MIALAWALIPPEPGMYQAQTGIIPLARANAALPGGMIQSATGIIPLSKGMCAISRGMRAASWGMEQISGQEAAHWIVAVAECT